MRTSAIRRTLLLFAFLIAVLLANAYFSYRAVSELVDSEKWLAHTYTVLSAMDALEFRLQDSQTSADDFVITRNPQNAAAFENYISDAEAKVALLQALTKDNPVQQKLIAECQPKVEQLKTSLTAAVQARQQGRTVQPPTGENLQSVMEVVGRMKSMEANVLASRSTQASLNLRTARMGLLVGSLATLSLIVLVAWLIVIGERQRTSAEESRLKLAAIVDSSDDAILSKTLDGIILSWNRGAEQLYGYRAEEVIGKSIFDIIPQDRREEMKHILETLRGGHNVDHLETARRKKDGTLVDVDITVSPLKDEKGKIIGASAIARDVSQRKRMEASLRELSARILNAQDEERRRIARELHDSTVQKLALLSMNLSGIERGGDAEKVRKTAEASRELANQCAQELRSISYLLHPPMLEELGLASALKIYAEGFSQRSGVVLDIEVQPEFDRLPHEMEIALFRVAQESLSNVLRHSNSARAKITLSRNTGVHLAIEDEGRGFAEGKKSQATGEILMGVGILGMRERMKQLGGTLEITSGPTGTLVTAHLPYAKGRTAG